MKAYGILGILFSIVYVIMTILRCNNDSVRQLSSSLLSARQAPPYAVDIEFAGIALAFTFFMLVVCLRLIRNNSPQQPYTDSKILDDI